MTSLLVNAPHAPAADLATLAREYLRVSLDRSGRARSLDEQHTDNERATADHGWSLGEAYRDNSVSASRFSRKVRDGFAELMADLSTGRFGANILVLWESSRGSRKVDEWVRLIDVCARQDVRIFVTTHGRLYDPANGRDRRSLLEDAVDSEYESSKVSDRCKRAAANGAAAGRPHGRVQYGFRRLYDQHTGALLGQEPHPDEAPVVRDLFARLRRGHSLRAIAADFDRRGVRTRSGKPFSPAGLRSLAVKDAYAGRRIHAPGRRSGTATTPAGATIVPATWEAIVPLSMFLAVQRILSDPARVKTRPGRGVHLLSMIARCAECDAPLTAQYRRDGRTTPARMYQCQRGGCVRVDADELDHEGITAIVGYLSDPARYADLTSRDSNDDDEHEEAQGELAKAQRDLDELADEVAAGRLSPALAARAEPAMLARLNAARKRDEELRTPSVLRALLGDTDEGDEIATALDIARRVVNGPMSARREIARVVLGADAMGVLTVKRRPVGRRGGRHVMPVAERVVWARADGQVPAQS